MRLEDLQVRLSAICERIMIGTVSKRDPRLFTSKVDIHDQVMNALLQLHDGCVAEGKMYVLNRTDGADSVVMVDRKVLEEALKVQREVLACRQLDKEEVERNGQ